MSDATVLGQGVDDLGRPVVADEVRERIRQAFLAVPEGRTGALLLVGDTQTRTVRGHLAAKLGDTWQVAAGGGYDFTNKTGFAEVAVMAAWGGPKE